MKQSVPSLARRARRLAIAVVAILMPATLAGCMHHAVRVEPVTIAPVRVTMDVNLHVDDARADEGQAGTATDTATDAATTTAPATE